MFILRPGSPLVSLPPSPRRLPGRRKVFFPSTGHRIPSVRTASGLRKAGSAATFTSLLGNQATWEAVKRGGSWPAIEKIWNDDLTRFRIVRDRYLLYPPE
jgi:hypothetical protein